MRTFHAIAFILLAPLAAFAQSPVTPQEIDWLLKNNEIDLRFKRPDGRTVKLQTIRVPEFARYISWKQPCWNKASPCEVASITARVFIRAANGDRLNRTRDSRLCAATECVLPAFVLTTAKPGDLIFMEYDRVAGAWRVPPTAVRMDQTEPLPAPPPAPTPAPSPAPPTTEEQSIPPLTELASSAGTWTLSGGHPFLNGKDTGGSGVVKLLAKSGAVYFNSSDGKWWEWKGYWFGPVAAP